MTKLQLAVADCLNTADCKHGLGGSVGGVLVQWTNVRGSIPMPSAKEFLFFQIFDILCRGKKLVAGCQIVGKKTILLK